MEKREEKNLVIVGTYRPENAAWIRERRLYNLPFPRCGKLAFHERIGGIVLFAEGAAPLAFKARFKEVCDRQRLAKLGYSLSEAGKAHGEAYALYELTDATTPMRLLGRKSSEVYVCSSRCPRIRLDAAFYEKPYPKTGGCSMPFLFDSLRPYVENGLTATVFDPVQMDFFPTLLKLNSPMKKQATLKFTFIDLFAGCGGLSLGLERAGFTPLLVNELNPDALSTYLLNRREEFPWLCDNNVSNVKDLVLDSALLDRFHDSIKKDFGIDIYKGQLDLICGGPPCQGFSGLGIRRSYSVEKKQLPSNYLYQDMAFLVNRIRPKIFLFENVRGLLSAKWTNDGEKGEIFRDVLKTFRDIGAYHVRYKLVHAKDYGVPQNRPRILIVGLRKDVFPEPKTNGDAVSDGFLPEPVGGYPTIEELLGDLIDPRYRRGAVTQCYPKKPQNEFQRKLRTKRDGTVFAAGEPVSEMEYSNHSDFIVEKFSEMIKNGGEIPERFRTKKFAQKVLPRTWGKDGPTITACSAPDDYVHFAQPRSLTVREWARLQTFPDWYVFAGKRTTGGLRRAGNPREGIFDRELPKYTQVGNAVPVELAYNVGKHFAKLLTGKEVHHAKGC